MYCHVFPFPFFFGWPLFPCSGGFFLILLVFVMLRMFAHDPPPPYPPGPAPPANPGRAGQGRYCAQCGAATHEGAAFCTNCGARRG
jgi:hypothetical protein